MDENAQGIGELAVVGDGVGVGDDFAGEQGAGVGGGEENFANRANVEIEHGRGHCIWVNGGGGRE